MNSASAIANNSKGALKPGSVFTLSAHPAALGQRFRSNLHTSAKAKSPIQYELAARQVFLDRYVGRGLGKFDHLPQPPDEYLPVTKLYVVAGAVPANQFLPALQASLRADIAQQIFAIDRHVPCPAVPTRKLFAPFVP